MRFNRFGAIAAVFMNAAGADGVASGGGPATTTAPAPAPAAPPAPAAVLTPAPAPTVVIQSGNTVVDYAMAEIAGLGIASNHPAMELAKAGNFSMLEVELAKTGKPTAAALVNMLKTQHEAEKASRAQALAESEKMLESTFGSAEQKAAALQWVSANADPAEATAINTMLSMGGAHAKIASIAMAALYSQHGSGAPATQAPINIMKTEPGAGSSGDTQPLTRRQFADESRKLAREVGDHNLLSHPSYKALEARRQAGIKAGI